MKPICPLMIAISCLLANVEGTAATYSWDFRNGHFDNLSLVPMGAGAVNLLQPNRDGLQVEVPAKYDLKTVGFSPRFTLKGDFEITLDFTIVGRSKPAKGFGTGPSLYLSTGSTSDSAASLGRLLRTDGRDIYAVFAARVENGVRHPSAKLIDAPPGQRITGRLQLKRVKDEITYSVSDDLTAPLRQIAALPMDAGEITLLRIGVSQSSPDSAAKVILHKIQIDADELPHLPSEQSRTAQLYRPRYLAPPPPQSLRWLWQSLAAVAVICLAGGWWWKRKQTR